MGQNPYAYLTEIIDNQSGRELSADKLTAILSLLTYISSPEIGIDIDNVYLTKLIDKVSSRGVTAEDLTAITYFISAALAGDDKGINVAGGQLTVGTNALGQELVVGEGDSYPVPIAYHCTVGDTSDLTIVNAVDITTILQSDTGSTIGLFGGEDAGNYILVGSDYTYGGVKAKIDTPGTIEQANVVGEYLQNDTPTWTTAYFMSTDADYPYTQNGSVLAASSGSEQWRFGFDPINLPVPWEQVTLNINGADYTKYWARFRITSNITLDPVIQQIKLHSNRWECNADGNTEYFGRARYPKTIVIDKTANADKNPSNQNISIASGITEIRTNNQFNNNANDGLILRGTVPVGLDSSIPVQLIVDWYPETAANGNVEIEVEVVPVVNTFYYDGSATKISIPSIITSVTSAEQYKRFQSIFLIPITIARPNDLVYGSLFRDATVTNTDDTYAGNIVITDYRVVGYFWRP